jgi:hypothetical protein
MPDNQTTAAGVGLNVATDEGVALAEEVARLCDGEQTGKPHDCRARYALRAAGHVANGRNAGTLIKGRRPIPNDKQTIVGQDLSGTLHDIAINEAAFALMATEGAPLTNRARAVIEAYESTLARLKHRKPANKRAESGEASDDS